MANFLIIWLALYSVTILSKYKWNLSNRLNACPCPKIVSSFAKSLLSCSFCLTFWSGLVISYIRYFDELGYWWCIYAFAFASLSFLIDLVVEKHLTSNTKTDNPYE